VRSAVSLAVALCALIVTSVAASSPVRVSSDVGPPNPDAVAGQFLIGFKQGVKPAKQVSILAAVGAKTKRTLGPIQTRLVAIPAANLRRVFATLRRNANIRYLEPNYIVRTSDLAAGTPNDPMFRNLWGLHNTGQAVNGVVGLAGVDSDVLPAWSTTTGKGVVVAVIDSGVDFSHPDLGGSATTSQLMWVNAGENCGSSDPTIQCAQRTNGIDDDGDGHVDDWRGWDFPYGDNEPNDQIGHGTHVGGTIAATPDNGIGIVGIAPDVKIMALKTITPTDNLPGLPSGSATAADSAAAVLYAVAHGARIINASWGGRYFSNAVYAALAEADRKGVLVVAAAGNAGEIFGPIDPPVPKIYPAAYELPNIISVAAHDARNAIPDWSFWGDFVDLAAPGVNILSTVPGGSYEYKDGTSMAAPHVAGAAALLMSRYPTLGAARIKAIILGEVRGMADTQMTAGENTWTENTKSHGALDIGRAVGCARSGLFAPVKLWVDRPAHDFLAIVNHANPVTVLAETCPPGMPITVTADVGGAPIRLASRGDGTYTGSFVPAAARPVTVEAVATTSAVSKKVEVSGRASFGYSLSRDRYEWFDVPSFGADTGLRSGLDGVTVKLPFPFSFYGQTFTTLTIAGKGWMTFGEPVSAPGPYWWPMPTSLSADVLPNPNPPTGIVAPFWAELSLAKSGAVWTGTVGTPPHRRFVVAWTRRGSSTVGRSGGLGKADTGVSIYSGGTLCPGQGDFEAIFDETTNLIRFEYQHVAFGCHPYGGDALIGIENFAGDVASQFSAYGYDPDSGEGLQPVLKPYERSQGLLFTP
jgi:subtilisin family serine protease